MSSITLEEAQARLPELINSMNPGEEIVITCDARPVARLIRPPQDLGRPIPGRGRGKLVIVSEDDEHLKDFEDYMS